jgi:hypothetical protein
MYRGILAEQFVAQEMLAPDFITGQGMPGAETDIHAFVWCSDDQ